VAPVRGGSGRGVILAAFAVDWYAARAAGVVAYLLVSASVALGLLLAGKERLERWPRFAVEDVHRFAGVLAGTFIAMHLFWLAVDSQAHLGVRGLLIPFTSSYRSLWTGLGIVAAELLLALAITNHYRKRLPYSLWRRLHYLNFVVWIAATGHGLGAGSDSGSTVFLLMYALTSGVIGALAVRRLARSRPPTSSAVPGTPQAVSAETRSRRIRA
jgi:methionine sulfoxide reductase heme-binding subunit